MEETRPTKALKLHPEAEQIPPMQADEWQAFRDDIAERGIQVPIEITSDWTILDGRHRWRAAQELALDDVPVRVVNPPDPIAYMAKAAVLRRHLTSGQRAALAAVYLPKLEAEAKERMSDGGKGVQIIAPLAKSRDQAAEIFGTNRQYVSDAKRLQREAPDVFEQVKVGALSIPEAKEEARKDRPHVAHNSGNNEWYTPQEYIDAARLVMGGIDLDPASTEIANTVVQAARFYTAQDNSLEREWCGRVWMNPAVCTCGIDPTVIQWGHGNKDLHEMLENLATHARILSGENGKGEVVFRLVQTMPSGILEVASAGATFRSGREGEAEGGEEALRPERQRARAKAGTIKGRQPRETTTETCEMVRLDTDVVGAMSAGMELPVRILWSGGALSTGSLHSAITSGLPRDGSGKYGPRVLEVQFIKGQLASRGVDEGQASVCPHCGAVGFSVARPLKLFCNPPYSTSLIGRFSSKIAHEYQAKHISQAIVLVNNATETAWFSRLVGVAAAVCFPWGRVRFWSPDKESAPLQGQAVLYIGEHVVGFIDAFRGMGWVATLIAN